MKHCPRCNIDKPLDEFPRDRSRKDGRFSYCKACNYAHSRKWVVANPERAAAYRDGYQADNPNKMREHKRNYMRRARTTAKGVELQRNATRTKRARARGATLTTAVINARVAECGADCVYCGGIYSDIDHVIPLSRGGTDDARNLVPCCDRCNSSKARRQWATWYRSRPFHSPENEARIARLIAPG